MGAIAPLLSYAINARALGLSEHVKAIVHVVVSAGIAALYTAITTNVLGWNTATAELLVTGVVAALAAHHLLWKPALINQLIAALFGKGQVGPAPNPVPPVSTP